MHSYSPISVVIITFNEEKNIEKCLLAARQVADDLVVIDSFSTDRTEVICKELGVRFVQHPFEGHIEQKNYAITQATYPHILSLDADEVLSEELIKSIRQVKENWSYDGYYINRLNNYCGKWIRYVWYPDRKLRLWDSRKGAWSGTNPHDRFELVPGSTTSHLRGDLLHYSFHSRRQHVEQIHRFATIKARMDFEKGKKTNSIKLLLLPLIKFLRDYFIKAGILDGYYGLVISINSSYGKFLHHKKLNELWVTQKK